MGIRAGIVNYVYDFNKINYKEAGETNALANLGTNKLKPDFDAGIYLKSNSFYCGISATHLNGAKIYNENINVTNTSATYNLNYNLNINEYHYKHKEINLFKQLCTKLKK